MALRAFFLKNNAVDESIALDVSVSISGPTISIGQALLILIDKYKNDAVTSARLKKLYFVGAQNPEDRDDIINWMKDFALSGYHVSLPPRKNQKEFDQNSKAEKEYQTACEKHFDVINTDPSRRYFETHLAFETLLTNPMEKINLAELEQHRKFLEELLPTTETIKDLYTKEEQETLPATVLEIVNNILKGDFRHVKEGVTTDILSAQEYSDAVKKVSSDKYYTDFSSEDKKKLELFVRCSFLCVTILRHVKTLPLSYPQDVYKIGFYAAENRGQVKKDSDNACNHQKDVRSHNLGLMLSYFWVPYKDKAWVDEAVDHLRVSDRNKPDPKASWVQDNFNYLVHPFSCSISGTMLIHHKVFKHLHLQNQFLFNDKDKFACYLKSLVSLFIYNSGGHSFHEFMYPLSLPPVRAAFSFIKDYDKISNEVLFFEDNKEAFDKAINKTIEYNKTLMKYKLMHHEIETSENLINANCKV